MTKLAGPRQRPTVDRSPVCPSCGQPIKYKDKSKKLHGWVYRRQVEKMITALVGVHGIQEAANEIGVHRSTISDIKNERVLFVRKDTAAKIVAAYKKLGVK